MQKPSAITHEDASHATNRSSKGQVVAVLTDLIFDSRLRSTAEAIGLGYRSVRTLERLHESLDSRPRAIVIVDMEVNGISACDAIAQSIAHSAKATVIAYYPHVQTELRQQAVDAGADMILPRSRFSAEITDILAAHARPNDEDAPGVSS